MIRVVLDTNVLVSALLSPGGPSRRIALLAFRGELQLGVDQRIREEYREVLSRGKFRFDPKDVEDFLSALLGGSQEVIAAPAEGSFPDEEDRAFAEVAVAFQAEALVTWNVRHFRAAERIGIRVVTPAEFLRWWVRNR